MHTARWLLVIVAATGCGSVDPEPPAEPWSAEQAGAAGAPGYPPGAVDAADATHGAQGAAGEGGLPYGVAPGGRPTAAAESADPGTGAWVPVPFDRVAEECNMDPAILAAIVEPRPWAIVRYGKMCWAGGGALDDARAPNNSATKTLAAAFVGMVAHATRDIPRTDRKTGTILDTDRADFWLDSFTYNKDATLGHVLAMEAHNADLSYGNKRQEYDTIGAIQINTLATVMNTALAQDPGHLGANLTAFSEEIFAKLGMKDSTWDTSDLSGLTGWHSGVGDMARLGLLMLNDGVWNGERLLDASWIYKMTHPAFEDGNTAYGYLTWLNARSDWHLANLEAFTLLNANVGGASRSLIDCQPAAINAVYPHLPSMAPDCGYAPPVSCDQRYDVGTWEANGYNGQLIMGMRGLDMVVVTRDYGLSTGEGFVTMGSDLWRKIVPAVVAHDPVYEGDVDGFCQAYANNEHAPDLR